MFVPKKEGVSLLELLTIEPVGTEFSTEPDYRLKLGLCFGNAERGLEIFHDLRYGTLCDVPD